MVNGTLLLKGEAKYLPSEMGTAEAELSQIFFQGDVSCFPVSYWYSYLFYYGKGVYCFMVEGCEELFSSDLESRKSSIYR